MPPKKKKGKGSKLSRMSEEERLRYLAHRAELELEAKRRKQQLIAVFTKNKLKREEAFARLNTAKINEQWRFILRQIKCKELYEDLNYLWKNFDITIKAKDAMIHKLYEELQVADLDHRRLQESHMEMIDKLIERHRTRLESMRDNYRRSIYQIEFGGIEKLNNLEKKLEKDCKYLETVIFAQSKFIEDKLMEARTRNAISTHGIEHSKEEEISLIKQRVGGELEDLWKKLNRVILEYKSSTEDKRKQYEYLKEQDDVMRLDAAQFPRQQSQLQSTIEVLKDNQQKLTNERYGRIDELKSQAKFLNDKIWKFRQEIRMNQTLDAIQLKRASVISGRIIKDLKRIEEKSSALLLLIRMCSNLEPTALAVKKYAIHCAETVEETNVPCVISPYDKMDKFWEQFNHVKAENIHKKREHAQLAMENKRLRHTLKTYLITVSRIPISRPNTSV